MPRPDLLELQQPRPIRDEQPDRELHGRHVFHQIESLDRLEHLDVVVNRRPRRERDEGRHQRQPDARAATRRRARSPHACAPSRAAPARASSTDSTADVTKRQPVSRSTGISSRVPQDVLDLDHDVVGEPGPLARERLDDAARVRGTVQEVGIAERDVLRARGHLARGCRRAPRRPAPRGTGRRTPARSGSAGTGACSRGSPPCSRRPAARRLGAAATRTGVSAGRPARSGVMNGSRGNARGGRRRRRCREASATRSASASGRAPRARRARAGTPRSAARTARTPTSRAAGFSRRTRSITGAASRVAVCIGRWMATRSACAIAAAVERLARQVDAADVGARAAQPGCGRREAERLASELVGGDQEDDACGFRQPVRGAMNRSYASMSAVDTTPIVPTTYHMCCGADEPWT